MQHSWRGEKYKILARKPEEKSPPPLGRYKHIWKDNIKTDLKKVWGYGLNSTS
jgi:hypothetical protein